MNSRDIREKILRAKLEKLAERLEIDPSTLVREAEKLGIMRDAREATSDLHININRVPTEEELREIVQRVIRTDLQL